MPTLANLHAPPPKGWDEFEDIVCSAAKNRWRNPDFTRHGRQGQCQDGVDVYGKDDKGQMIGLQCKNTVHEINETTVDNEVKKAAAFKPPLTKLYIATTASTDKNIQAYVRKLSAKRRTVGGFEVNILFWNDIWNDLTLEVERVYQHYPQLNPAMVAPQTEPSHDLRLFNEFQSTFPFNPAVRLLREHDFGAPFLRELIQPLYDFVSTWDQPEKFFFDRELQSSLANLHLVAREMSNLLCEKTALIGNGDFASVFSDSLREAGPRPDWVNEDARILNSLANTFVPIYEEFLQLCQTKLLR